MALARQSERSLLSKPSLRSPLTKSAARRWARGVIEADGGREPIELVQHVASEIRSTLGRSDVDSASSPVLDGLGAPPGGWQNPWLLGLLHEYAVSETDRKSRGAWYTPEAVVRGLVTLALPDTADVQTVADPTCGGGAFLLAVLDRLVDSGLTPEEALGRVSGMDIDADAVLVTKLSVQIWALRNDVELSLSDISIEVGDALLGFPEHWVGPMVIVGNPPFASPLRKGAIPETAERYRSTRPHQLQQYADLAAIHLLSTVEKSGPGSTVVLVQPQSVLASRDTETLRDYLANESTLEALWVSREAVFDAGVRVCAPLIRVGGRPQPTVELWSGPEVQPAGETTRVSWARCAARALGAPTLPVPQWNLSENLGSLSSATAGFRDEYYGLLEACSELPELQTAGDRPVERLLTVGSVEPLVPLWGDRPTRLGGRDWVQPAVDRKKLSGKVLRWVDRQAKPKVVLATQSKVLEPVVDFDGIFVPVTPLIAVHGSEEDLGLISAVLLAPPIVAWAWERWFGSAMAVDALKLAAKQVLELPLPVDREKWGRAGSLILEGSRCLSSVDEGKALSAEVASLMTEAYRADRHVLAWWLERLG